MPVRGVIATVPVRSATRVSCSAGVEVAADAKGAPPTDAAAPRNEPRRTETAILHAIAGLRMTSAPYRLPRTWRPRVRWGHEVPRAGPGRLRRRAPRGARRAHSARGGAHAPSRPPRGARRGRPRRRHPARAPARQRRRQPVDPRLRPRRVPHGPRPDRGRGDGRRPRARRGRLSLQPRHHRRRRHHGGLRRRPRHQRAEPPDHRRSRRRVRRRARRRALPSRGRVPAPLRRAARPRRRRVRAAARPHRPSRVAPDRPRRREAHRT